MRGHFASLCLLGDWLYLATHQLTFELSDQRALNYVVINELKIQVAISAKKISLIRPLKKEESFFY